MKKKLLLRKRGGTYYVAPEVTFAELPANRKAFNHCGHCGASAFREKRDTYACKKCKVEYGKNIWRYQK